MNYPGANKSLTVESAVEIISRVYSLYSDFPYNIDNKMLDWIATMTKHVLWEDNSDRLYITSKNNLQTFVNLAHIMLDGQSEWIEGLRITEEALRQLSDEGKAEQISKDEWEKHPVESELSAEYELTAEQKAFFWFFDNTSPKQISEDKWRIPPPCQQILGEGKSWVYLYYFDKEKAKAQDQRNEVWPCKIGLTQKDPEKRIQQQLEEDSDIPIIALLLRTDEPELLEKTIHGFLRLHGRHIVEDIQGREWFRTNPEEVVSIYKLITDWECSTTP